ncbi:hypothetical protein GCM10007866_21820 [Gluconobacter albidus]|uniref:Stress-induced protein n=1 Tax=Gluconobacter albidus TaxID=318683 RepID=A0ABQ5X3C3_9PROT|nr:hypothetical protein AA3250_1424 [Gluconobacter albidus NBRC 3250]GLQ69729.1 hypothetical protein GCM10007866_21820 [Gluconobacter albidus]
MGQAGEASDQYGQGKAESDYSENTDENSGACRDNSSHAKSGSKKNDCHIQKGF